jgi:hypothetical protein
MDNSSINTTPMTDNTLIHLSKEGTTCLSTKEMDHISPHTLSVWVMMEWEETLDTGLIMLIIS